MTIKIYAIPYRVSLDTDVYALDEAELMAEIPVNTSEYLAKREEALIRLGRCLGSDSNLMALHDEAYGTVYYYWHEGFGEVTKIYGIEALRKHLAKCKKWPIGVKGKLKA